MDSIYGRGAFGGSFNYTRHAFLDGTNVVIHNSYDTSELYRNGYPLLNSSNRIFASSLRGEFSLVNRRVIPMQETIEIPPPEEAMVDLVVVQDLDMKVVEVEDTGVAQHQKLTIMMWIMIMVLILMQIPVE